MSNNYNDSIKFSGSISFFTDGDYFVDMSKIGDLIKDYKIENLRIIDTQLDDEHLFIDFKGIERGQLYHLCEFLIVNFGVVKTHYWLVKDLYDYINGIMEWLKTNPCNNYYRGCLDGNYEFTECEIYAKNINPDSKILHQKYEVFKLQWLIDHGYTLTDIINELEELRAEADDTDVTIPMLFSTFENDIGLNGSLYPCFDEWMDWEYYQKNDK